MQTWAGDRFMLPNALRSCDAGPGAEPKEPIIGASVPEGMVGRWGV